MKNAALNKRRIKQDLTIHPHHLPNPPTRAHRPLDLPTCPPRAYRLPSILDYTGFGGDDGWCGYGIYGGWGYGVRSGGIWAAVGLEIGGDGDIFDSSVSFL